MVEFRLPKKSRVEKGVDPPAPEGATRTRKVNVYRWDPDQPDQNPRLDTYSIDWPLMDKGSGLTLYFLLCRNWQWFV